MAVGATFPVHAAVAAYTDELCGEMVCAVGAGIAAYLELVGAWCQWQRHGPVVASLPAHAGCSGDAPAAEDGAFTTHSQGVAVASESKARDVEAHLHHATSIPSDALLLNDTRDTHWARSSARRGVAEPACAVMQICTATFKGVSPPRLASMSALHQKRVVTKRRGAWRMVKALSIQQPGQSKRCRGRYSTPAPGYHTHAAFIACLSSHDTALQTVVSERQPNGLRCMPRTSRAWRGRQTQQSWYSIATSWFLAAEGG